MHWSAGPNFWRMKTPIELDKIISAVQFDQSSKQAPLVLAIMKPIRQDIAQAAKAT
jgi:hypothetical protein